MTTETVRSPGEVTLSFTTRLGLIAMSGVYLVWNLIAALNSSMEFSWDSDRYFSTIFDPQNPGFVTTALFRLVENHTVIMFVLVAIYSVVWLILVWAIIRAFKGTFLGWMLSIFLLLLSLSTPLWSWNTVLLSESLTTSAVVLWIASLTWLVSSRVKTTGLLVWTSVSALVVITSRPQLLIVIIPAQLLVLFLYRQWVSRGVLISNAAIVIAAIGVGLLRIYQFMASGSFQYLYVLHNFIDKNDSFRAYALETMPRCEPLEQALAGPAPWPDTLTLGGNLVPVCPETWLWFNSDAAQFPAWFFERPAETISNFFNVIPNLMFYPMSVGQALPSWLSNVLLNPQHLWLWTIAYVVVSIILVIAIHRSLPISVTGIVGGTLVAASIAVFVFIVWGADGYDLSRHMYPVVPFLGIAALAIFPVAVQKYRAPEGEKLLVNTVTE